MTLAIVAVQLCARARVRPRSRGPRARRRRRSRVAGALVLSPGDGARADTCESPPSNRDTTRRSSSAASAAAGAPLLPRRYLRPRGARHDPRPRAPAPGRRRIAAHALVTWPEAAIWVDPRTSPDVRSALVRARAHDGGDHRRAGTSCRDRTTARRSSSLQTGVQQDATEAAPDVVLGENGDNRRAPRPVATPGGLAGTTLGVDNQDPSIVRATRGRGGGRRHVQHPRLGAARPHPARIHAACTRSSPGVPVVRADWRYGSAIYAADGERVADAGEDRSRTVVVADVGARPGLTPYVDVGDALGWAAAAFAALAMIGGFAIDRASRARGAAPPRRRPVPSSPA